MSDIQTSLTRDEMDHLLVLRKLWEFKTRSVDGWVMLSHFYASENSLGLYGNAHYALNALSNYFEIKYEDFDITPYKWEQHFGAKPHIERQMLLKFKLEGEYYLSELESRLGDYGEVGLEEYPSHPFHFQVVAEAAESLSDSVIEDILALDKSEPDYLERYDRYFQNAYDLVGPLFNIKRADGQPMVDGEAWFRRQTEKLLKGHIVYYGAYPPNKPHVPDQQMVAPRSMGMRVMDLGWGLDRHIHPIEYEHTELRIRDGFHQYLRVVDGQWFFVQWVDLTENSWWVGRVKTITTTYVKEETIYRLLVTPLPRTHIPHPFIELGRLVQYDAGVIAETFEDQLPTIKEDMRRYNEMISPTPTEEE